MKLSNEEQSQLYRFFKWFTFWKICGITLAIIAWYGDCFLNWQSNIGYYFTGMVAYWCMVGKRGN